MSFADVMNVLEFVYTGSLKVPFSQLQQFLSVAKTLGLAGIPDISLDVKQEEKSVDIKAIIVEQNNVAAKENSTEYSSQPMSTSSSDYWPCVSPSKSRKRKPRITGNNRKLEYKCKYCPSSFAKQNGIYNHQRYCYSNPNRLISRCSVCKQEVRPGSMQYHKKRYHN